MTTVNAAQQAVLDGRVRGLTYLIDLDFSSGPMYVTTMSRDIAATNGHNYTAVGQILEVDPIRGSEVLTTEELVLKVSITNPAMLAYLIGPASVYRGRAVRLYLQAINEAWAPVEDPMPCWTGYMSKVRVDRRTSTDGKGSGSIDLVCVRSGLAKFRNAVGLRLTHEQQQRDYPGDRGMEYAAGLVKTPPVWLTKAFQEVK